jgi:hypothetical protein
VKLYSGDKPVGLFADQLPRNLERLNHCFTQISAIFSAAGIADFAKLPDDLTARAAFAQQFNRFPPLRKNRSLRHGRLCQGRLAGEGQGHLDHH